MDDDSMLPLKIQQINQLVNKNEKNLMKTMIELNFKKPCRKLRIAKLDDLDKIINPDNLTEVPTKEYSQYYNHYKARVLNIYLDRVVKIEDRVKLAEESNINNYKRNIFENSFNNNKTYYLELPLEMMEDNMLKKNKDYFDSYFYNLGNQRLNPTVESYYNIQLSQYFDSCTDGKEIIKEMDDNKILKNLWVVSDDVIAFSERKRNTAFENLTNFLGYNNQNKINNQDNVPNIRYEMKDDAFPPVSGGKRKSRRHLKRKSRKSRKTNKKASKKSKKSRRSRKSRR